MADDLQGMWPQLTALEQTLKELTAQPHVVTVVRPAAAPLDLDAELRHRETMAVPVAP